MITKRTGHGQTECTRCRELGRFALNWDSFLYTFNGKPYCFDCLMEMLEEKDKTINNALDEIERLKMKKSVLGVFPDLFDLQKLYEILGGKRR